MKKTIGVVAEGPRDFDLISALIDDITGEENDFQHLQPEPNANGEFGNGWKGVWKWCESHQEYLHEFFYSVTPHLDMLVIHMDADVSRREKEVHCWCNQSQCTANQGVHPLSCSHAIEKTCPIELPCGNHENTPEAHAEFLKAFLCRLVGGHDDLPICFVTPCDCTDAWIVAAYEDGDQIEQIHDPWETVICHAPSYHDVRIQNRPNKSKGTYRKFIDYVVPNWSQVCSKCPQARAFDRDIRYLLTELPQKDDNVEVIGTV